MAAILVLTQYRGPICVANTHVDVTGVGNKEGGNVPGPGPHLQHGLIRIRRRPTQHVAVHVGAASELGGVDEEIGVEGRLPSLALVARVRARDLADKLDVRLRRGVALG